MIKSAILHGMARKTRSTPPVRIAIHVSQQMSDYIDALVVGGLHGRTQPEVAVHLLGRQLEEFLTKGILIKLED